MKNEIMKIEKHNFEDSKNKLKKFSEQTQKDLNLKKVEEKGELFWIKIDFLDRNVTGKELNELTSQIQEHLIELNNTQVKVIKEFGEVYNTFESLDKEYINGILLSIEGIKETNERIEKNIYNIDRNQNDIKQILDIQKKITDKIIKFKNEVESYEIEKNIKYLEERLNTQNSKTDLEIEALKNEINSYNIKSEESIKYLEERLNTQNSKTDSEIEALKNHINSCNIKIEEILETNRSNQIKQNKLEKRILISNVLFGFITVTLFLLFFIGRK